MAVQRSIKAIDGRNVTKNDDLLGRHSRNAQGNAVMLYPTRLLCSLHIHVTNDGESAVGPSPSFGSRGIYLMGYPVLMHSSMKCLTCFKEGTLEIGSMVVLSMVVGNRAFSV